MRRNSGLCLLFFFATFAAVSAQQLVVVETTKLPSAQPGVLRTQGQTILPINNVQQRSSIGWEKDLTEGRKAMGKKKLPMLLFLTAPSCQYCEVMKAETFKQQWIIREVNKKYIPVMINGREHKDITEKLSVRMFPAVAIVHPDGKVLDMVQGYKSPADFVKYLAVAQAKLKIESEQIARREKPVATQSTRQ